ncbi:MAG: HAD hydrolase-like protein [Acidimicrobiia bacterium]|nr:HAD hydrolase-like protein [Acidimicrobiia bacterium]
MQHVVWDWNGTLLNDLEQVVQSVNVALASFNAGPITADDYRAGYTRPVVLFYEHLLSRPVSDEEWEQLDIVFHHAYREALAEAQLTPDALAAMEAVDDAGWTQSLLSMFPHDELLEALAGRGIGDRLVAIDGLRAGRGDRKYGSLVRHLEHVAHKIGTPLDPTTVVMIGDALDDADAAEGLGIKCVLYASGSHPRAKLEATGHPVSDSLIEALAVAGVTA